MLNKIDLKIESILIQMGIDPCKFESWKIEYPVPPDIVCSCCFRARDYAEERGNGMR